MAQNNFKTFELIFAIYLTAILVNAKDCSITVSGPKPNKPCVFPFEFSREKHYSCTDLKDPGNPWCSTKVDKNGKHIGGANEWGYCEKGCDGSSLIKNDRTAGGAGKIFITDTYTLKPNYKYTALSI